MTEPIPSDAIPVGEDDLQAFVDGRLPPERLPVVERYLRQHPLIAVRIEKYIRQAALLTSSLGEKFDEPVPARLRIASIEARRRRRLALPLARVVAVALLVGLSGAWGWTARLRTEQGVTCESRHRMRWLPMKRLRARSATLSR